MPLNSTRCTLMSVSGENPLNISRYKAVQGSPQDLNVKDCVKQLFLGSVVGGFASKDV